MTVDTREQNALRYWRKQRGLSQKELGEAIGINKMFISLWENGHSQPTQEQALILSQVMDIPITQLFTRGSSEGTRKGGK